MEKNREYDQVKTAFFSLFYVFVLSEIAGSVGTMIDSIIVGKLLEPSALAALSLGRPCFAISKAVAAVLASGGMFRYSTYIGRSELAKAKQVFPLCLNVCVMGGILFTFIMLAFIPEISVKDLMARNLDDLIIARPCLELLQSSEVIKKIQIINGLEKGNLTRALAGKPVGTVIYK